MTESSNDWRVERDALNAKINAELASLNIVMAAEFVPASRFKGDDFKSKAINFTVDLCVDNGHAGKQPIYSGPYAYGVGKLPGYRQDRATKMYWAPYVDAARERGVWPSAGLQTHMEWQKPTPVPAPELRDAMYSLLSDASAIDHPDFESWASDYGYGVDSRSAESIYRACLETGLRLRAALGDDTLAELRELFQDY